MSAAGVRRAGCVGFVICVLCAALVILMSMCSGDDPAPVPPPRPTTTTTVKPTTTTTVKPPSPTLAETLAFILAGYDYHNWPDWRVWHAIGVCEQGGHAPEGDDIAWHGQSIGGLPGSGYPGGLGIMRAAWDENREQAGVSTRNGAHASPADQIRVARVIRQKHGLRAWSCGRELFPGE